MLFQLPWQWNPGQHLVVIGETGSGKSSLMERILSTRRFFVVIRTKPDEVTYPVQIVTKTARTLNDQRYDRIELAPPPQQAKQRQEIERALDLIFKHGGWTNYIDERFYVEDTLHVSKEKLNMLSTQGRSKKITLADGAQRPTGISRFVLSQATHVICFGIEPEDARTLASRTSSALAEICLDLRHHEFAWWNRITRRIWKGMLDPTLTHLVGREITVTDTRRRRFQVV